MHEKDYRQFEGGLTINDLYPDLSSEEQAEAEYRMLRYLAVVKNIFERIARENPQFLTELERRAMLRRERISSPWLLKSLALSLNLPYQCKTKNTSPTSAFQPRDKDKRGLL